MQYGCQIEVIQFIGTEEKELYNETIHFWWSSNSVHNFVYKISLPEESRHIKAYKHIINPGSASLNFSGSRVLPSSFMR